MTKQSYFWATPSGPIRLIEGDKMPQHYGAHCSHCAHLPKGPKICECDVSYQKALQASKESSVPIQNREVAKGLIYTSGQADIADVDIKPDTIYGPFTVEYTTKQFIRAKGIDTEWTEVVKPDDYVPSEAWEYQKVAILYDDTPEKERPDYINKEFKKVERIRFESGPS